MQTPATTEESWIDFLGRIPAWLPDERPTVVVSPHPDDETLAAGGLIATQRARQIPVTLLAVTDGEAAYPDTPNLAQTRRIEQTRAAAALGLNAGKIVRLGLPDSSVTEFESTLADQIEASIDSDTLVVAPWPRDPHPDHEACGRAAAIAAGRAGAPLISYFFWTWHHFTVDCLHGSPLRRLILSGDASSRRTQALACHRSQLYRNEGPPILPEIFLAPARRTFETFIVHDKEHGL